MNSIRMDANKMDATKYFQSRRDILKGAAALGVAALLPAGRSAAQAPAGATRRIDVHHHFGSPRWKELVAARKMSGYQTWAPYSPEKAIEDMDKGGVATSMISLTTPGIWFGNIADTKAIARDLNDYGAGMVSSYPGRFGLFAALPFPDADACLKEIEYAFDTLKADGVGLLSSYSNKWLGDPSFAPVFRELNRRKTIVYTHAQVPDCCQSLIPGVSDITIEYNTDTARTIVSLIDSGRAVECPDINFIFSHAGGTILALPARFLAGQASAENLAKTADTKSRLGQLRRFYYDVAGSNNPVQMHALKTLVGTSQIVFGTDFPFGRSAAIAQGMQSCGFSAEELKAIDSGNALKILPRYA